MHEPFLESAEAAYQWQQDRRKSGGRFDVPVGGFGPDGGYTLWLASPEPVSRIVFRGGEPIHEILGGLDDQEAIRHRDAVLRNGGDGAGGLDVPMEFVKYAVAVIRLSYELSDDDLTFLLAGTKWHNGVMRHLLGGEDVAAKLAAIETSRAEPSPPPQPLPRVVKPSRSLLSRLLARCAWG